MYTIRYKTKKGGSGMMTTDNLESLENRAKQLCGQKLEAIIYKDNITIGQVWRMESKWNYSIETE